MNDGIWIFIALTVGLIGYLIGRAVKQEALGYNGATMWKEHMWCKKCKKVYPQYGINPSVYNCSYCGDTTTYAMARYVNGKLEVKDRR